VNRLRCGRRYGTRRGWRRRCRDTLLRLLRRRFPQIIPCREWTRTCRRTGIRELRVRVYENRASSAFNGPHRRSRRRNERIACEIHAPNRARGSRAVAAARRSPRRGNAAPSGMRGNAKSSVEASTMNAAPMESPAAVRDACVRSTAGVRAATMRATAAARTAFLRKSGGGERGETKRRCANQDGSENGLRGGWIHDRFPLYPEGRGRRVCLEALRQRVRKRSTPCGQLLLVYETVRGMKRLQESHSADSSGPSNCGTDLRVCAEQ